MILSLGGLIKGLRRLFFFSSGFFQASKGWIEALSFRLGGWTDVGPLPKEHRLLEKQSFNCQMSPILKMLKLFKMRPILGMKLILISSSTFPSQGNASFKIINYQFSASLMMTRHQDDSV